MPLLLRITFAVLGVSREVLFLLWVILGDSVTEGNWSETSTSAIGDGVVMCDTEKRPCTLEVWTVGDLPLAGDGLLDFGDFFAGVAALGEGDLDFGVVFPGVGVLGDAFLELNDFLGDGVLIFFSYKKHTF